MAHHCQDSPGSYLSSVSHRLQDLQESVNQLSQILAWHTEKHISPKPCILLSVLSLPNWCQAAPDVARSSPGGGFVRSDVGVLMVAVKQTEECQAWSRLTVELARAADDRNRLGFWSRAVPDSAPGPWACSTEDPSYSVLTLRFVWCPWPAQSSLCRHTFTNKTGLLWQGQ